jgi:outer membrane immunogenic protein
MKRILVAGALLLGAIGQPLAADLPPGPPPPRAPATYVPVVSPLYNWGGVYVGINGGWGFGNSTWTFPTPCGFAACTTGSFNVSGGLIGGTLGFNYQIGEWVLGIEGDGDWSNLNGTFATGVAGCGAPFSGGCQTASNFLGTVRGRVGYAFDRVLVFGTAGGAFANVQAGLPTPLTSVSTQAGWTAGGGVEYGITDYLTAKIEYLYVGLQDTTCGPAICGGAVNTTIKLNENVVRGGLNFKFGGF